MKILLVEDNPDLCRSMEMLLGLVGHEVRYCESSLEALNALPSLGDCQVLITDYYLPDMNGIELIRRMRKWWPHLPAILLTGSPEDGIVKAAQAIPGVRLLRKPVELETLEQAFASIAAQAQPASLDSASAISRMSSGQ